MRLLTSRELKTGALRSTGLAEAIRRLDHVAEEMASQGLVGEAASLRTTIGDLQWQFDELFDKELAALWPNQRQPS